MDNRDPGMQAGPLKVTLGGFTEFSGIYRTHNDVSDVGSTYFGIPFPSAPQYYEPEFRESARQSRFAVLAQLPRDGEDAVESYMETDFLTSGSTSNSNESNSYALRMRHFYGKWTHGDWYLLAGQTWSLATMFKSGLNTRTEDIPLTIDAQYVVGFNWARQAQLRFVENFGNSAALGLSLEEPQIGRLGGPAANGAVPPLTGNGGGLLNTGGLTTYSSDIAPDVVLKLEAEPGFGHYEVYSLTRFLHDRARGTSPTLENHTTVAESIGFGVLLPIVPKVVDFKVSGLIGHGNARYGSGQLTDAVYNLGDGSYAGLKEQQLLAGLTGHPIKDMDAYLYAGWEHETPGYGIAPADNRACNFNTNNGAITLPAGYACGTVGDSKMITGGFWWKMYKGKLGYVTGGPQITYLANRTFTARNGTVGTTTDPMVFLSIRYFPYQ